MPETPNELYEEIKMLAAKPKPDFLDLADRLRDLWLADRKGFASLWADKILARRRAIYLRDIARVREQVQIPNDALIAIGWMKAWLITRWAKKAGTAMPSGKLKKALDAHLKKAQEPQTTVRALKAHLEGDHSTQPHCVMLHFSIDDYEVYRNAILANGGRVDKKNQGLAEQEQALLRIIGNASHAPSP